MSSSPTRAIEFASSVAEDTGHAEGREGNDEGRAEDFAAPGIGEPAHKVQHIQAFQAVTFALQRGYGKVPSRARARISGTWLRLPTTLIAGNWKMNGVRASLSKPKAREACRRRTSHALQRRPLPAGNVDRRDEPDRRARRDHRRCAGLPSGVPLRCAYRVI